MPNRKTLCQYMLVCACSWVPVALSDSSSSVPNNNYPQPLSVRAWTAHTGYFPETSDPEYADSRINEALQRGDPLFGIAFSGGGTRSAAATLGQLWALWELGWLSKAHYVTAVSGGSWTVVPFTFLPDRYCDEVNRPDRNACDEYFLGDYKAPQDITEADLRAPQDKDTDPTMRTAISSSRIVLRYIGGLLGFTGDETYARALGKRFLRPFFGRSWRHTLFTHNEVYDQVKARLGGGVDVEKTVSGRPFMIVGASLLAKKRRALAEDLHPLEITPTYTGMRDPADDINKHGDKIGGGYVESIGYDTFAPDTEIVHESAHNVKWKTPRIGFRKRYRFTLRDIIGVSGAAPVKFLANLGFDTRGFPEFNHWPIRVDHKVKHREFRHGDGGHVDNTGLLPLLVRQVDKIIVFVNSASAFCIDDTRKRCRAGLSKKAPDFEKLGRDSQMGVFFHKGPEKDGDTVDIDMDQRRKASKVVYFGFFEEDHFGKLEMAFRDRKINDQPLVYCNQYMINIDADNRRFGVMASRIRNGVQSNKPYIPKICWVYLDRTEAWASELKFSKNDRYLRQLSKGNRRFKRFPHYQTFFENKTPYPRAIDLKRVQVNALRYLTAWTVLDQEEYIRTSLDF